MGVRGYITSELMYQSWQVQEEADWLRLFLFKNKS